MKTNDKEKFDRATDRVALHLQPFGHLLAATDPVLFMEAVADRLDELEKIVARLQERCDEEATDDHHHR